MIEPECESYTGPAVVWSYRPRVGFRELAREAARIALGLGAVVAISAVVAFILTQPYTSFLQVLTAAAQCFSGIFVGFALLALALHIVPRRIHMTSERIQLQRHGTDETLEAKDLRQVVFDPDRRMVLIVGKGDMMQIPVPRAIADELVVAIVRDLASRSMSTSECE